MKRPLARLRYVVESALRGLRASPVTTAVAVATLAVALVLAGAFGLLVVNMQGLLDRFGRDLALSVYLEDDAGEQVVGALAETLGRTVGVERFVYVSRQQALERFQQGVGAQLPLLEALDENPLPASFEVTLASGHRTPEGLRAVASALEGAPGVADLGYGLDWVEGYARAVAVVRAVGLVVGGVLVLATLVIVANTIRLAIYARRDEIEILTLVGAGRGLVAVPFVLEGLLQGALAAGLALALLFAGFQLAAPALSGALELVLGSAPPVFFTPPQVLALLAAGTLLGGIGSLLALLGGVWR